MVEISSNKSNVATPSLLDHLTTSLQSFPGSHKYTLQIIRSQPRRSYALFPYASNQKQAKIWQEEILVVLNEERDIPVAANSESASKDASAGAQTSNETAPEADTKATRRVPMPVVGLEVSIYTIPSSSCSLVYVSKVDTTGLSPSTAPSPARTLVASFLAYHIVHPPHDTTRLRIHVFAKSQPMYLFPGSIENKGKRVLDDKGLIRWWKSTLTLAASLVPENDNFPRRARMHYLIPGMNYLESLPYVPASIGSSHSATTSTATGHWSYGHGYTNLTSPLHPLSASPEAVPLTDLIPCFPDDPKSRFVSSITSSVIAPSGNQDDYDDVMLSLKAATFATGRAGGSGRRRDEIETERAREGARLAGVEGGLDGWWEMMQWRQECCAGKMVAFFLLVAEPEAGSSRGDEAGAADRDAVEAKASDRARLSDDTVSTSTETKITASTMMDSTLTPTSIGPRHAQNPPPRSPCSLPQTVFIRLWSQFHNMDYNENGPHFDRTATHFEKWTADVERLLVTPTLENGADESEEQDHNQEQVHKAAENGPQDVTSGQAQDQTLSSGSSATASARALYDKEVRRDFMVDNPLPHANSTGQAGVKRKVDGGIATVAGQSVVEGSQPKVNMLAPRKKKPKVV